MSKTIIIGGSAAGAAVAARLRRLDEHREITIYEKGPDVSYASCGLPYFVGGVLPSRQSLVVTPVKAFVGKYNVNVKTLHEVTAVSTENKTVTVKRLADNTVITDTYDSLVIATGASPFVPESIQGTSLPQVKTLRTIEDAEKIRQAVTTGNIKSVVIAGGGFIGVELAENLAHAGVGVTLVELKPEVLGIMDQEFGRLMTNELTRNGVDVRTGLGIKGVSTANEEDGEVLSVELSDGTEIKAGLAVMALGVKPNTAIVRGNGIELDSRGFIKVNQVFETSVRNVYAAGDNVTVNHLVTGNSVSSTLAGPAARGARIIANTIAGVDGASDFPGTSGSGIVKAFNLQAGITGFGEEYLSGTGLVKDRDYFTAFVSQKSHVAWFPGAGFLFIKGIFDKQNGRILGVEAVGSSSVDKIIDVASALILKKGTFQDLTDLDLSYAPQFNAPKSPLNMLGFTAENIFLGLENQVGVAEYLKIAEGRDKNPEADDGYYLLDVREPSEVTALRLPHFINIPLGTLRDNLGEIPKDKLVLITCAVGVRAWNAARILAGNGYRTTVLSGGSSMYSLYVK